MIKNSLRLANYPSLSGNKDTALGFDKYGSLLLPVHSLEIGILFHFLVLALAQLLWILVEREESFPVYSYGSEYLNIL